MPCRQCSEDVEIGAAFCWNCGVDSPHLRPPVTGNTEVRRAPTELPEPAEPDDFEWESSDVGVPQIVESEPVAGSIRRGSGSPPLVPAEPTAPRAVGTGLPPSLRQPAMPATSFVDHDDDEPPTMPRLVVSMIAEELDAGLPTDVSARLPPELPDDGSEPLSLAPEIDMAVAKRAKVWPNLGDEVAELQLLILRGFESEAREAWRLLVDAHPGHPDLVPVGEEIEAMRGPAVRLAAPDFAGPEVPDITKVSTRTASDDDGPPPFESPTSPTFVEGTEPPPGGFAQAVAPNVTPAFGIESARRLHMPSSDSLPTNPRMMSADVGIAGDGVRIVMLGTRGQTVWERTLPLGESMEISRDPMQPWGDDPHVDSPHVRLHATTLGVQVEPLGGAGVYRQVDERLPVRDGDEYRVGESVLRYASAERGWGSLTWFPLSGAVAHAVQVGGAGLLVGRENADIEIPEDTFVSGAHCRFTCGDEGLFVEDLGSANGTYALVRPGESVPFGGLVLVGQTQFKILNV